MGDKIMLHIDLTFKEVLGEAGPNIVWHGQMLDFKEIVLPLLGSLIKSTKNNEINITSNNKVFLFEGFDKLVLRSNANDKILVKINGSEILTSLSIDLWQQIYDKFVNLANNPCHNFVEFDNEELIEEGTWIIASDF